MRLVLAEGHFIRSIKDVENEDQAKILFDQSSMDGYLLTDKDPEDVIENYYFDKGQLIKKQSLEYEINTTRIEDDGVDYALITIQHDQPIPFSITFEFSEGYQYQKLTRNPNENQIVTLKVQSTVLGKILIGIDCPKRKMDLIGIEVV